MSFSGNAKASVSAMPPERDCCAAAELRAMLSYAASFDKNAANALSMDMAQRVGVYLSQKGINTTRMFIVGRGAARPIAAQDNIGRLTNRRVEIRLSPAR
jgi:outer membrane protein OmpA-like peptidoglycan-associated protein